MNITELLTFAHKSGASDAHVTSGEAPRVRIHGDIKRLKHDALSAEEVHNMVFGIMSDAQQCEFQETNDIDFSFELGDIARFRVNVFRARLGEAAVFRTIPTEVLTLEDLGLPQILKELSDKEKGLVLVTGPTGSGKSTTLAAMVDYVNNTREAHILHQSLPDKLPASIADAEALSIDGFKFSQTTNPSVMGRELARRVWRKIKR